MEPLDLSHVFFRALGYPAYARPDFFIHKQRSSGWAKGVYLHALSDVYESCKVHLDFTYNAQKRRNPSLKREEVLVPIKNVTKGDEPGEFNEGQLTELHIAILRSYYFERLPKEFIAVEILSFVEYALSFIRREFRYQAGLEEGRGFRPRTTYYFHYSIAQDAPFVDFVRFKHSVRDLLVASRNLTELKLMLDKIRKVAIDIVKIWNDKLYLIEQEAWKKEEYDGPTLVKVEFNSEQLSHQWHIDEAHFSIHNPRSYSNQDLALYAIKIANQLSLDLHLNKGMLALKESNFLNDFKEGMKVLLQQDNAECIRNVRNGQLQEGPFRDWFDACFHMRGYMTSRENLKGAGHIDLKVRKGAENDKIIEFKGWWNDKKKQIVQQLCNYLTQFEIDGYIFMVNHTAKDITIPYKSIVAARGTGYIAGSWRKITDKGFAYYKTKHQWGQEVKEIHHFIISMHKVSLREKAKKQPPPSKVSATKR